MKILVIILNRVYLFLTKVKNQSPLLGASILVSILIGLFIRSIFLFIYAFKSTSLNTMYWADYMIVAIIFLLIYYYAKRKKQQVVDHVLYSGIKNNLFTVGLYIFVILLFVILANINRDKISKLHKKEHSLESRKESLENKIREWFK